MRMVSRTLFAGWRSSSRTPGERGRELGVAEAQNFDVRPLLDLVALGTIADLVR